MKADGGSNAKLTLCSHLAPLKLDQVPDALRYLGAGTVKGKIVVTI